MKFWSAFALLLLTACATPPKPQSSRSPSVYELISLGLEALQQGNSAHAINSYFGPAIANCLQMYQHSSKKIYAARSLSETLYYQLQLSGDGIEPLVVDSACADAFYYKGYASLELGDVEEAEKSVRQAIELSPVNARYQSELGHIFHLKNLWQQALELFEQAEQNASDYAPKALKVTELARAKRGVGRSLIELGHWDLAEKKFRECLNLNPKDRVARSELQYIDQIRASF